jgi:hypothetical protein
MRIVRFPTGVFNTSFRDEFTRLKPFDHRLASLTSMSDLCALQGKGGRSILSMCGMEGLFDVSRR